MLREGPIPAFVHGVLEYFAGAALIAAPILLGYDSGSATAVSIVLGILVLVLAATTDWATGLTNQVPISAHLVLDLILALALVASPFLFSFSEETNPTVAFIALGVVHLLVSIGTRFVKDDRGGPRRTRGRQASERVDPPPAPAEPR